MPDLVRCEEVVDLSDVGLAGKVGVLGDSDRCHGEVAGELRRQSTWSQKAFELFHLRDRNGLEVGSEPVRFGE